MCVCVCVAIKHIYKCIHVLTPTHMSTVICTYKHICTQISIPTTYTSYVYTHLHL